MGFWLMNPIAHALLSAVDWSAERTLLGNADEVPGSVKRLAASSTDMEATAAYWELDNRVVVQGQLFSAALHLVPVLLAVVADQIGVSARRRVLELLFQIGTGVPDESERLLEPDLAAKCHRAVADGLWLYVRGLLDSDPACRAISMELVDLACTDPNLRATALHALVDADSDAQVRVAAQRLGLL